jgi:sRNA-binding carbon storage regulator CsrA
LLKIDLRPGESIRIGDVAVVTLERKDGKIARLSIQADKSIPVSRTTSNSPAQIAAAMGITGSSSK